MKVLLGDRLVFLANFLKMDDGVEHFVVLVLVLKDLVAIPLAIHLYEAKIGTLNPKRLEISPPLLKLEEREIENQAPTQG